MTETKKYVRIKKSSNPAYWYADRIGEVFEVEGMDATDYAVFIEDIGSSLVLKKDAELIVTEKRPAKVGDKVLILDDFNEPRYMLHDVVPVIGGVDEHGVAVRKSGEWPIYLNNEQYEVIVNNEAKNEEADGMKIDLDAMGYDELIAHGEAVLTAIQLRSYNEGYKQGKFDAEMDTTYMRPQEKGAQVRRDEIVEQAKADIAKLAPNGVIKRPFGECDAEFIVNRNKRTVVVLIKGRYYGRVYVKGIAKAAPDDCFNVHIGKAIALHRALGIEVPDEYLNAPQPTEVRVGDVVAYRGVYKTIDYATVVADGEPTGDGRVALTSIAVKRAKIIDDSRMEVGE
ncbi:hypothetical protein EQZ20_06970 [Bacillus glycinifermentans]|uniref:Uncharacterized protein n=2 Tax=Bacillus glycinifermentans TaxID=1664069 RepID=A0AAJ3Z4P7_9BACI|nr:hypothetical protein EQZ20_06970 [Bacillus glycinifermentans]